MNLYQWRNAEADSELSQLIAKPQFPANHGTKL